MGILIKAPTRRRDNGIPVIAAAASVDPRGALHIREVVRITGLRREQLYMWQRRRLPDRAGRLPGTGSPRIRSPGSG
jgi:hypothetical protein